MGLEGRLLGLLRLLHAAAGILIEQFLAAAGLLFAAAFGAGVRAVGLQVASLYVVVEIRLQNVDQPAFARRVLDRDEQLDAPIQIPRHPVGAGKENQLVAAMMEVQDSGVLEVAVDDARSEEHTSE